MKKVTRSGRKIYAKMGAGYFLQHGSHGKRGRGGLIPLWQGRAFKAYTTLSNMEKGHIPLGKRGGTASGRGRTSRISEKRRELVERVGVNGNGPPSARRENR